MPTVEYIHACNFAFLDDHGRPCLVGILSDLVAPSFPYHRAAITIAASVRATPGPDCTLKFELASSDGDRVLRYTSITFDPPVPATGIFLTIQMVQIFFPTPGLYTVRVVAAGAVIGATHLRVIESAEPTEPRIETPTQSGSHD